MWNSSTIQCKICKKICDVDELSKNNISGKDLSEEDRNQVLNLSNEYFFSELWDWNSISCKDTFHICVECFGVISRIQILDDKIKTQKADIRNFCDQFVMKVLKLRNQRNVKKFPNKIGGVAIKVEKGVDQELTCKICHETYNELPMCGNEYLNLKMVAKVIRICKKYFFSEIFDRGTLDVDFIVHNNILPFCFDCCISIQELFDKSDSIDITAVEIENLVNSFFLKILIFRKSSIGQNWSVINDSFSTPDNSFQDTETPAVNNSESDDDDDDDACVIVEIIPAGWQRDAFASLCNKLRDKEKVPGESTMQKQNLLALPDRKDSSKKGASFTTAETPTADRILFPGIADKVPLSSGRISDNIPLSISGVTEEVQLPFTGIHDNPTLSLRGIADEAPSSFPGDTDESSSSFRGIRDESLSPFRGITNTSQSPFRGIPDEAQLSFPVNPNNVSPSPSFPLIPDELQSSFPGITNKVPSFFHGIAGKFPFFHMISDEIQSSFPVITNNVSSSFPRIPDEVQSSFPGITNKVPSFFPGIAGKSPSFPWMANKVPIAFPGIPDKSPCFAGFSNKVPLSFLGNSKEGPLSVLIMETAESKERKTDVYSGGSMNKEKGQPIISEDMSRSPTNRGSNYHQNDLNRYWPEKRLNSDPNQYTFLDDDELSVHEEIQEPVRAIKCSRCDRSFARRSHLANHRRANLCVAGNLEQILEQTALSRIANLRAQRRTDKKANDDFNFSCRMCPLKFTHRPSFTNHLKTHYDIVNPNKRCDICRQVFTTAWNRKLHVRQQHGGKIPKIFGSRYHGVGITPFTPILESEKIDWKGTRTVEAIGDTITSNYPHHPPKLANLHMTMTKRAAKFSLFQFAQVDIPGRLSKNTFARPPP